MYKPYVTRWVLGIVLGFLLTTALQADYLKNADLKKGKSGWRGDGELVFLKPDGTEGEGADADVTPVLKIKLKRNESQSVYQEFHTKDKPKSLRFKVEVCRSSDFKRSDDEKDYTKSWNNGTSYYWTGIEIPHSDFWIRGGPGWLYWMQDLKTEWQTVQAKFADVEPSDERIVVFCVPPGVGHIYLKNPTVTP